MSEFRDGDPRWQHVQRVVGSETLSRSRRLRDLLLFIGRAAVEAPATRIGENEIATVFGRPDAADHRTGDLVRAHARHLREKLARYNTGEGANDPMVMELPAGTFVPVFRERLPEERRPPDSAGRPWVFLIGALIAAIVCAWLAVENHDLRRRLARGRPPAAVERVWREMFDNGLATHLVLADANVTLIQDLLGFQVPVAEYDRGRLNSLVAEHVAGSERRILAGRMLYQRQIPLADLAVAQQVLLLHTTQGLSVDVLFARDATPATFTGSNAILSGPRRANPWIELFEPQLNFQSRFDESTKVGWFENIAPRPGEQARYAVVHGVRGFCRVAYLPGLDRTGNRLLLTGTDMASTEVAAEFIASERWIRELRRRFGLSEEAPLPRFEVLLGAALVTSTSVEPEWIAHRVGTSYPR
jgi:hypothetical protein